MAVVIASGQGPMGADGTIRWAISGQGPALAVLRRADQNRIIRISLRVAGRAWIRAFLPKRFTDYVERSPFPYDIRRRDGFFVNKARRMGLLQPILHRFLQGWDPWSADKPPRRLVETFKTQNPGKYRRSITGQSSGLYADLRAWGKRLVRTMVMRMKADFLPLVESRDLRKSAGRARAVATATASRQQIRIKVPFPGPRNPRVGDTIRTVPRYEVAWIAQQVKAALVRALNTRGLAAPGGFAGELAA